MTTRARLVPLGLVILLATGGALIATNVVVQTARAEAPAGWQPLLLSHPSEVRAAPRVAVGSAEDLRELDEIVARQARSAVPAERIAYWTGSTSPARWNEILLGAVREAGTNPVRVSRTLALLNAAIYDAIIAACDAKLAHRRSAPAERDSRIRLLAPPDELSSHASVDAAIAAAAVAVLGAIYPDRASEFERQAEELIQVRLAAGTHTTSDLAAGTEIGQKVGAMAVVRAGGDNAGVVWQGEIAAEPGGWMPARPFLNDQPTEPLAGTWRTWLLRDGSDLRPGPPPAYLSPEWQAEADEVVRVNQRLTDDQVRIARFWADGAGTDTPPGHWMRIAIELSRRDRLSSADAARLFAHLAIAQADAFIACWDAKFAYLSGRPAGLIPGFAPTIITPNFPSYISGHATLSGASSVVLAAFFPSDAAWLTEQAEEAALSRLYGGIHWRSDNEVGLQVGRQIGSLAVARAVSDGALR